jgi:hypothetical protein
MENNIIFSSTTNTNNQLNLQEQNQKLLDALSREFDFNVILKHNFDTIDKIMLLNGTLEIFYGML